MNLLIDPNVSYVLLVIGLVLSVLALFSPGTGIIEIGALFALVLAGIGIWNLPINWWALVILVIGIIPFLLALKKSRHWIWLLLSILALVIGSVFIFKQEGDGMAVHPVLAGVTSIAAVVFLWFIGRKSIDAMTMKPVNLREDLIGKEGETRTEVNLDGTVYVGGEEWTARSEDPIPAGMPVRVIGRDGLVVVVEPVEKSS